MRRRPRRASIGLSAAAAAAVVAVLISGCGGSSSKPGYCGKVDSLKQDVGNFSLTGGVSSLKQQLEKVEADATSAVNSAKSDFPNETQALKSSLEKLKSEVADVSSNPSASQIAAAAVAGHSMVQAVDDFVNATKSKCQ